MGVSVCFRRNLRENSMETLAISASARTSTGKGAARKARSGGATPGVLYKSGGSATPLSFNVSELAAIFRRTRDPNSLIRVQLDGESRACLVREIQRDPVSRVVLHVDFLEVAADETVTVPVAVASVGRAAGTRAGGTLRRLSRTLDIACRADSIPAAVEIDVTALNIGEFVKASQVVPPEGTSVRFKADFNVFTVEGKRVAREEAAAAAAAAKAPKK